ncbi:hypothetical protein [Iningainema tapete]|uniref:Uncharacterized protein n=1 Tax=Iningainema tapete BLCC-T55 TaxID=2748662 RepID=A0A8J6XKP5_9CYAN|nr:hypothetical protein [Iningainema tapete]MBD2773344.1 hypothetical protein [Iningainema tapete BLCC-T55]
MRYVLIFTMLICILLSGCEYFIPHTSDALSQTKQLKELQKQTEQIEQQTKALDRLANSAEKITNSQN